MKVLMTIERKLHQMPLVPVAVALVGGMVVAHAVAGSHPVAWGVALAVVLVAALLLRRHPSWQGWLVLAGVLLAGGLRMALSDAAMDDVVLPDRPVTYEAVVATEPVAHGRVVQCDLYVVGDGSPVLVRASLLRDSVTHRERRLHVGDGLRAYSLFTPPHSLPGASFDYGLWLRRHGYRAQTFIYYADWQKAEVDMTSLSHVTRARLSALSWREQLARRFHRAGLQGRERAVVTAMTLGDRSLLTPSLRADYAQAGASHVLALSGLHLSILYLFLSLLTARRRHPFLSQGLVLAVVWSYVFMVGLPLSAVRAALMVSLYGLVDLLRRAPSRLNTLSLAAVVILVVQPQSLYDVGFQLSFLAVLSMLLVVPLLRALLPGGRVMQVAPVRWIVDLALVSVAAQVGTAPLVVHVFGYFSSYFLLANLLAIPCAYVLLSSALLLALTPWCAPLNHVAAMVTAATATALDRGLIWIAHLPGATITPLTWTVGQTLAVYVLEASLLGMLYIYHRHRYRRPIPDYI